MALSQFRVHKFSFDKNDHFSRCNVDFKAFQWLHFINTAKIEYIFTIFFWKTLLPLKTTSLFFRLGHTEWKCLTWPPKKLWWTSCHFRGHFVIKMIEQQLYSINRCQRQTSTAQMDGIVPSHHKFLAKLRKGERVSRGENDMVNLQFQKPSEEFLGRIWYTHTF